MRAGSLAFAIALVVVAAVAVDAMVEPAWVATNDGPHHVFGAYARAHIDDADKGYARFFTPNVPATANGFAEIFAVLEPSLGWQRAHAWALAIIALVWTAASWALVSSLQKERRFVALVVAASGLGWTLALGFFSFVLGTALAFLVVALALRFSRAPPTPTQRAIIAGLLAITALVHFLAAALAGALVLVVRLASVATDKPRDRRALLRELALVVAMGVPAVILVLRAVGATENHEDALEQLPLLLRVTALGGCTVGGPAWRQAFFAAFALVSALSLVARWRTRSLVERALGATALVLAAFPLVLPWTFLGWQNAAVRPLPLAAAILIALLPVERMSAKPKIAVAVASCAFALASSLWARWLFLEASDEMTSELAAIDTAQPPTKTTAGYRWPFVLESLPVEAEAGMLRWDPMRGLGSLFAVSEGGFTAYSHVVSPQAHTVLLRPDVERQLVPPLVRSRWVTPVRALDGAARDAAIDALAIQAVRVAGVIALEHPDDHRIWLARGYARDVAPIQGDAVFEGHFVGCPVTVTAPGPRDVVLRPVLPAAAAAGTPVLTRAEHVNTGDTRLEGVWCGAVDVDGCGPAPLHVDAGAVRCP